LVPVALKSTEPRVRFIVTNLSRPVDRVVAFYNQRGTAEQWIKEGKNAIKSTRLSCCSFAANAVRLQLALAYNLTNFMRTLALPEAVKQWSLTRAIMAHPTDESESDAPRLNFDRRLKLEFHGSDATSWMTFLD
jgi:hypothetical protein